MKGSNHRWLCGVPKNQCCGATVQVGNVRDMRVHGSPQEAFFCYRAWLMSRGWKETAKRRELINPQNGRITVLTKPAKFGARLRGGKRGIEGSSVGGHRLMWPGVTKGGTGGCIVSS